MDSAQVCVIGYNHITIVLRSFALSLSLLIIQTRVETRISATLSFHHTLSEKNLEDRSSNACHDLVRKRVTNIECLETRLRRRRERSHRGR